MGIRAVLLGIEAADGVDGRRAYFWLLRHSINPLAVRAAWTGHGPFSIVRHVGRRTGKTYETPLILAPVAEGFVAELTYGPDVAWYRNALVGGCEIIRDRVVYRVDRIEPRDTGAGLAAFPPPARFVLWTLRRRHFVTLHVAGRWSQAEQGGLVG